MSNSLNFWQDAGMTVPFTLLEAVQTTDGGAAAVDRIAYLGSTTAGNVFQATSDPGVDDVLLTIVDSETGLQIPDTTLRLALSLGGLDGATPGADLVLGTDLLSGAGNAMAVHVRIDAAAIAAGNYDNLSLVTSETVELTA